MKPFIRRVSGMASTAARKPDLGTGLEGLLTAIGRRPKAAVRPGLVLSASSPQTPPIRRYGRERLKATPYSFIVLDIKKL